VSAPAGWLLCNGQSVSRTTYSDLFAAIETNFGSGDGATTFNVPDMRGRFLRGWDNGAGRDPDRGSRPVMTAGGNSGDNIGSIQADEIKSHWHYLGVMNEPRNDLNIPDLGGTNRRRFDNTFDPATNAGSTFSSGGSETRPVNAFVNYIIKY